MDKNSALSLARTIMDSHGLNDWHFEFDRATRRFGQCNYGLRRITISRTLTLLNSEDEVRNTILHEVAHALVGPGHGHDAVWRAKAREIGNNGRRTHSATTPQGKWAATCKSCKRVAYYQRRPRTSRACGVCCRAYNKGKYDAQYEMVITAA